MALATMYGCALGSAEREGGAGGDSTDDGSPSAKNPSSVTTQVHIATNSPEPQIIKSSGVHVTIPADTTVKVKGVPFDGSLPMTVSNVLAASDIKLPPTMPQNLAPISKVVLGPSGAEFSPPLDVSLTLDPNAIQNPVVLLCDDSGVTCEPAPGKLSSVEVNGAPMIQLDVPVAHFSSLVVTNNPNQIWPSDWMTQTPGLANKSLNKIYIPASHDTGTLYLEDPTWLFGSDPWAPDDNGNGFLRFGAVLGITQGYARAQDRTVLDTLNDGVRAFDLRACATKQHALRTCHSLYATYMVHILNDVRAFADAHPKEVVILEVSHFHGWANDANNMEVKDHQALTNMIINILGPHLVDVTASGVTPKSTLQQIWGTGQSVIVVYADDPGAVPGGYTHDPRFLPDNIVNSWGGGAWDRGPKHDILSSYIPAKIDPDQFFIFSGQGTPDSALVGKSIDANYPQTLKDLAAMSNPVVLGWVKNEWSNYPLNLIAVDFCQTSCVYPLTQYLNGVPQVFRGCSLGEDTTWGHWWERNYRPTLSCEDGEQNQTETDVDCGGPCAVNPNRRCANGKGCNTPLDCMSGVCVYGVCQAPSCEDGMKDQGESDIDCGGPCTGCAEGKGCKVGGDCASAVCFYGVCQPSSCEDGVKNQGESDIDCGGPCARCAIGSACNVDSDCASKVCFSGTCKQQPGLVDCWGGDGNGADSVGSNHATVYPDTTYAAGKSTGQAFQCSGSSGWTKGVEASARPDVSSDGPWTYELWVNRTSCTDDAWIVDRKYAGFSGNGQPLVSLHCTTDGSAYWYLRGNSGAVVATGTFTLTQSQWVHVAVTRGGGAIKAYSDGVLVSSSPDTLGALTPDPPRMCGHVNTPNQGMVGRMESFRIWNRDLSASEVQTVALGDGTCTAPTVAKQPGLVDCWGGNGNSMDFVGDNWALMTSDVTYAAGKSAGLAFQCSRSTSSLAGINVGTRPKYSPSGPWTYELWVNRTSCDKDTWIVGDNDGSSGLSAVLLHCDSSGSAYWAIRDAAANPVAIGFPVKTGTFTLPQGQWAHVAVTRGDGYFTAYLNGSPVSVMSDNLGAIEPTAPRLCGRTVVANSGQSIFTSDNQSMVGKVASFRIWDRALSGTELQRVAEGDGTCAAPTVARQPGLVDCWGGDGNGADSVGSNNATVYPDMTYAAGKSTGQAFQCSGTSGAGKSVEASARPNVSSNGPWTYELWVNRTSCTNDAWIVDRKYAGFSNGQPLVSLHCTTDGSAYWYLRDNSGAVRSTNTFTLPQGQWVHVAVTRGGGVIKAYRDGVLVSGSLDMLGPLTPDPPRMCGHVNVPNDGMVGKMESFRIWNRELSASEVQAVALGDGTCTAPTTRP
ncbi:Hypothetical protein A7982_03388 [Minicystis rosea]|nr:Hypothetical protein A7982_03388 [Minicystis rosea]